MKESNPFSIPLAIVVAGALVAGSIIFVNYNSPAEPSEIQDTGDPASITLPEVTSDDHIRGNVNASVVIVEYSDYECPYCKQFHTTMKQIAEEYEGKVAWVLRHFPLEQIHPNAPKIAQASECVADLGGNDAFWKFTDSVLASTSFLDMTQLSTLASQAGANKSAFTICLDSGKYAERVETQLNDAIAAGGRGTPYSVIIAGDKKTKIDGAQPYAVVKSLIEKAFLE